jgi:hypothetical protein
LATLLPPIQAAAELSKPKVLLVNKSHPGTR